MKITITGAAGFLGSEVVKGLCAAGHEVRATDVLYRNDLPVRIELEDLLQNMPCYRLVEGAEVLVHLGNHKGPGRCPQRAYGENLAMNANIIQAAQTTGVKKIIFASTVQVIAGNRHNGDPIPPSQLPYLPIDGQIPPNPGNLYALSKVAAENMLAYYTRNHGLSTIAVRFPLLVSPVWASYYRSAAFVYDNLDEAFAYQSIAEAAELVTALAGAEVPGFHTYMPSSLGVCSKMSVREIAARYFPDVSVRQPLEQLDNLVDNAEITRACGWTPKFRLHEKNAG